MKAIREAYKNYIENHMEESRRSALEVKDYLEHSSVAYHGRCVHTLHIPKIFTEEVVTDYKKIVDTTYGIFCKVIQEYLENADYRKLFPFSKELEELILVPNLYDSVLPIARFDIFYNEENGSFKFCEINTDGTSAMNEDYVLNQALALNNVHTQMKKKYDFRQYELFDSWVDTCLKLYQTYEKKKEHPYIAIVDFLEHCSITEFEEFQRRFQQAGYECEICEITQMKYRDHVLYSPSGHPVDLIYRRAVTTDVCEHYMEVQDFVNAVKQQDVCIMGSFCTQIIHNKWLFKILREQPTLALLTKEEQEFVMEHIPYTNLCDERFCKIEEITGEKDRWIIKPLDSYASRGVFAGIDYTQEEWSEIVERYFNRGYIYQEYYPPYRTENIYLSDQDSGFVPYTNMSGLFVYNGSFAGIYSRLSDGGIISSQYNEKATATMVLVNKQ
ncbi:MAG: glutathionylspermidine synthase family protein [Lachnospiraceae bacterium]|nr:glutathionylspermidine synthase family protein [Lachnospiraceae bacterium]